MEQADKSEPTPAPALTVRAAPTEPPKDTTPPPAVEPDSAPPRVIPVRPRPAITVRPKVEPARAQPMIDEPPAASTSVDAGIPAVAPKIEARLRVVIGGSFANIELEDLDRGTKQNWTEVVEQRLVLAPGTYELRVMKPGYGRFRPRRIQVMADGSIVEKLPSGGTKALPSTLRLKIPEPGKPSADPDWSSDAS